MSWLSSLFSRKKQATSPTLTDFSFLGTDMHSHIIPSIDDGATNIEESIALVRSLVDMGFKKIITTPHIMGDFYRNTPENIQAGLKMLREAVKSAGIPVEIEAAAEYYLDEDFIYKLKNEPLLTFGDNYLLFELSYLNPPENLHEILFMMQAKNYKPVLAHPERYLYWMDDLEQFTGLVEKGALLQLNINSLAGYYGKEVFSIAQHLIKHNMYSFTGSDVHHQRHTKALQNALQNEMLHQLADSGKLLNKTL